VLDGQHFAAFFSASGAVVFIIGSHTGEEKGRKKNKYYTRISYVNLASNTSW
jgi:hypothetical protein